MLGITTGRNRPAPTHKRAASHEGRAYDIGPNGEFTLSNANVKIDETDEPGKKKISITAGSTQQALGLINQVLSKFGKSIDDFQTLDAKTVTSYMPVVEQNLSLGGPEQLRSIAKMLLTYAATLISPERLRDGTFEQVIDYINNIESTYDDIHFDQATHFPTKPFLDEINHRVFFTTSHTKKLALGLIEIYGKIRFSAVLSREWNGPSICKAYAINPVTQEQTDLTLDPNEETFNLLDRRGLDMEEMSKIIGELIEVFQERQTNQTISKITTSAIEKHMTGKGRFITKDMIENVSYEVASEFAKFHFRIDSVDDVDLKK